MFIMCDMAEMAMRPDELDALLPIIVLAATGCDKMCLLQYVWGVGR